MKKYKIEFEEVDDPEYREISDWFNSFTVTIWEDDSIILVSRLVGVDKFNNPIKSLIGVLYKAFGKDEEDS